MNDLNILTYNIHKGKSFFLRNSILKEVKSILHKEMFDFIFLQEVRDFHMNDFIKNQTTQTKYLSDNKYISYYGKNKVSFLNHHGNAIFTNKSVLEFKNFNISVNKYENRGLLFLKVKVKDEFIYLLGTHLNLIKQDRLKQVNLINDVVNEFIPIDAKVILAGDFNDFDSSVEKKFNEFDFVNFNKIKSFPSVYPLFNIDKIFVRNFLNIKKINSEIISNKSILLSDHLAVKTSFKY